jgi:hypothetical protein
MVELCVLCSFVRGVWYDADQTDGVVVGLEDEERRRRGSHRRVPPPRNVRCAAEWRTVMFVQVSGSKWKQNFVKIKNGRKFEG